MHSIVKRLRERGRRLHNRDISAQPGIRGELVVAICGHCPEAKIYEPTDQQRKPIIPELHNVQLLTMTATGMLLYGTECGPDGAEYVQEWSVRMTGDSMA